MRRTSCRKLQELAHKVVNEAQELQANELPEEQNMNTYEVEDSIRKDEKMEGKKCFFPLGLAKVVRGVMNRGSMGVTPTRALATHFLARVRMRQGFTAILA